MKKLSRILAALLAVVLLLSCSSAFAADYTAPKKLSKVKDLPEMPEVPSMKTKVKTIEGEDIEYVTVDGEFESLTAVWGKGTLDLEFEDGKAEFEVGALNKKYKTSVGYKGTTNVGERFPGALFYDSGLIEIEDFLDDEGKITDEAAERLLEIAEEQERVKEQTKAALELKGKYHLIDKWSEEVADNYFRKARLYGTGSVGIEYYVDEYDEDENTYYLAYYEGEVWYTFRTSASALTKYGHYDIPGVEYAFEGVTADGVEVLYDTHGNNTARVLVVDDVNFFDTEDAPEGTEFVWVRFQNMYGTWGYYLQSVTAYYGEDSEFESITAWYPSNGKLAKVEAIKR